MANLEPFFKLVFGRNKGYLCIATLNSASRAFKERFFEYPAKLNEVMELIDNEVPYNNLYFCPNLFNEKKRRKEFVSIAPNSWADLDRCDPKVLLIKPSVIVESSPNRYQAYWLYDENVEPEVAEEISRRIAYYHKEDGADVSGWDLTQLLRIPNTTNYKYQTQPEVKVLEARKAFFREDDFNVYPETTAFKGSALELPSIPKNITGKEILELADGIPPALIRSFNNEPEEDWSQALWFLELMCFESNLTAEQTFVVARDAACNKYARDSRAESQLWREVQRAEEHFNIQVQGQTHDVIIKSDAGSIITPKELKYVDSLDPTFIDNYINWASGLSDAAKQYHQAGAFVILSALISGSVTLPTSYGEIIPNLWFMILADTTLTRKSTSMDIAVDLLEELATDSILATDGSLEGMLTALAMRPKKPSVFLRDEFSGLIDAILKKDYLAGMAEMFTKLYDGKLMKRILKREVVEVRDPRLIIFAGGIKDKVTSLLTQEHISSGFIPRFCFITAESDISKVRPLGPPTAISMGGRKRILEELGEIHAHYNKKSVLNIGGQETAIEIDNSMSAFLTDEAWERYTLLEYELLKLGQKSWSPSIMMPVCDRLSKSIIKAAVLIAASRQRGEAVSVELDDLLRAIKYGEEWRNYAEEIVTAIGTTGEERSVNKIYEFIEQQSVIGGVSRSLVCRTFKLPARKATEIFATLEARGMIMKVEGTAGGKLKYAAVL